MTIFVSHLLLASCHCHVSIGKCSYDMIHLSCVHLFTGHATNVGCYPTPVLMNSCIAAHQSSTALERELLGTKRHEELDKLRQSSARMHATMTCIFLRIRPMFQLPVSICLCDFIHSILLAYVPEIKMMMMMLMTTMMMMCRMQTGPRSRPRTYTAGKYALITY